MVQPILVERQVYQEVVSPKQLIVPIENGHDFEGYLEMVDGFLSPLERYILPRHL